MKKGIVLFGHGSRNPEWRLPFEAIQQEIARQSPGVLVEQAFLELMQPTLAEAIARLARAGVAEVMVVPVFISAGNHVREDLPALVSAAQRDHGGLRVSIAAPLGEAPEMIAAMARYALGAA